MVRSAEFLGRGHHAIGEIAAASEGPAAIAISRGGAPKPYAYTDPNEDACCFVLGPGGSFAAVADGHHGARGAERVVRWLVQERASAWTAEQPPALDSAGWSAAARQLIADAHTEVLAQAGELHVASAPTTLSVALVRPQDDLLVHASIGDSHVFVVAHAAGVGTRDLGWASTGRRQSFFAGDAFGQGTPEDDQSIVGCESLAQVASVVLVSDGLSERGIGVSDPPATVDACVRSALAKDEALRPLEACRAVTEAALEAHRANRAGDNVAAAVLWPSTDGS